MNKRNYKIAINIIRSISLIRVSREEKKGPRNTVPKKKKSRKDAYPVHRDSGWPHVCAPFRPHWGGREWSIDEGNGD